MKKRSTAKTIELPQRPTENDRLAVRLLVRAREDFQAQRKRMDNRIGRKADGTDQNIAERAFRASDLQDFVDIADAARTQEQAIEKRLKQILKRFPIYTEWLATVKGVGTISQAMIVAEFNIEKATTVSKMWQYSGMNPSMVRGKERIECANPETYTPKKGTVIARKADHVIVQTDTLIRGDKMTKGFVCPFNKRLRTALLGVLADSFIKAQAPYAIEHYYPYKERLAQSENEVEEIRAKGKDPVKVAWKDAKPAHRDRAAKRKMIKMFLADLYRVWRELEGLPVRPPYQEEYLGHRHAQ